jgi:hypothetical protein
LKPYRPVVVLLDTFRAPAYISTVSAGVVKQVDALDSKSSGPCAHGSSILPSGTKKNQGFSRFGLNPFLFPKFGIVTEFVTVRNAHP